MTPEHTLKTAKKVGLTIAFTYCLLFVIWITNSIYDMLFGIVAVALLFLAIYCINKHRTKVEFGAWLFLFLVLVLTWKYFR
jgi:TctA family transporter